ncbi:hypothetical protein BDV28DRAFT_133997 [Aspergillus coremiiformis]|uniref:Uncharacterized protein n=1 Tax=Aspergillus coremiiformis TaxID=138285 RepID=A0A5N6Z823_9EURO|nr:hypothetical protein BDV28DRAFT_133997 [Aspergillus coremiiformis]
MDPCIWWLDSLRRRPGLFQMGWCWGTVAIYTRLCINLLTWILPRIRRMNIWG